MLGPLIDLTGANGPRVTGIHRMATISQAVMNGRWRLPRGRHPITILLKAALPIVPVLVQNLKDEFKWRNTQLGVPGVFSASQTWTSLHPSGLVVAWCNFVWFSQSMPKHAFVYWVVPRDRLPKRDRLQSWRIQVPNTCLLCTVATESRSHLFFDCAYATQVWESFFSHTRLNPPIGYDLIVEWVRSATTLTKLNTICKLLLQAIIYEIWKERNSRLHKDEIKPSAQVVREIQSTIRRKLAGLDTVLVKLKTDHPSHLLNLTYHFGLVTSNMGVILHSNLLL